MNAYNSAVQPNRDNGLSTPFDSHPLINHHWPNTLTLAPPAPVSTSRRYISSTQILVSMLILAPPLRTIWTPCLQRTENHPESLESCFKVGRSFWRCPPGYLYSFQGFGVPCNSLVAASSTNLNPFDPETARAPALPHKQVPSAPPASGTLTSQVLTEYTSTIYTALETNPGSTWASCANPSA